MRHKGHPKEGNERLKTDVQRGKDRIVLERFEWPHGWGYHDSIAINDPTALEKFKQKLEDADQ